MKLSSATDILYVLDVTGSFRPARQSRVEIDEPAVVEKLLRFCQTRFEAGTEIAGQIDGGNFLVICGAGKAAVGLAPQGSRPVSLRDAVEKALIDAQRGLSLPASSPAPSLQEVTVPGESPFTSMEEISEMSFSMTPAAPQRRSTPPAQPTSTPPGAPGAVEENGRPTWEEVRLFVDRSLSASTDYVGPAVAANYWRQAIKNSELDGLTVDFRGQCTTESPTAPITADEQSRIARAFADWMQRCRRVIPDFDDLLTNLNSPPWNHHSTMEKSR